MTKLRGMCIGAGYFSRYHLDAWARIPEVEIVAVCDADEARARAAGEQLGIDRVFSDAATALREVEVDFMDIITPPDSHLSLVEMACWAAAKRGCAIICQKPLAPDLPTARRLVEAAESAGVRFMVHENFRFQPWHREIKRLLDAGAIGEKLHTLTFRSRPGDGWGQDAYLGRQPYFRHMPRLLVFETGVHFIDTFRFLAGEITEVHAVLRRLNPVIHGEDAGLLTFRFAGGAVGVWDANRCNESTDEDPRYTFGEMLVEGSGGSIRLYGDGRLTVQPLGQPEGEHEYERSQAGFGGDCVHATQRHFIERLLSGEPFETNGRDYLKTLEVQEAAYHSAEANRPIAVSPGPRRIVDLTLPIDENMPRARIEQALTIARDGWNATTLTFYSHCGTHMDAPRHFVEEGMTIEQLPLEACVGPARVLDLTPVQPRELIGISRLAPWLDVIQPGDRLLLRTDWHKRFGSDSYRHELPRISIELARWLVERRVALVGVEPPSVADVNDIEEVTAVHRVLLGGGVVIVEGLANLDRLRSEVVQFIALPLPIVGGDGCPVRAMAIEE